MRTDERSVPLNAQTTCVYAQSLTLRYEYRVGVPGLGEHANFIYHFSAISRGVVHAWVGQIVEAPSRRLDGGAQRDEGLCQAAGDGRMDKATG